MTIETIYDATIELHFQMPDGSLFSGTTHSDLEGYTFHDFFTCDLDETTSEADLAAGYRGADCDGIGVKWTLVREVAA